MSKKDNYDKDGRWFPHSIDREKKVYCMCKPISNIRGKSAQELLEFSGQTDRVPVDLKILLEKLNISCVAFDFSPLDAARKEQEENVEENPILGALATNGDKAVIFYRKEDQEEGHRYRFTIAHELAHACLQHYSINKSSVHLAFRHENSSDNRLEYEANIFAGQLLIPRNSLERVLQELIFPSLAVLSDIFAVSMNVMRARLDHLEITKKIAGYNC